MQLTMVDYHLPQQLLARTEKVGFLEFKKENWHLQEFYHYIPGEFALLSILYLDIYKTIDIVVSV